MGQGDGSALPDKLMQQQAKAAGRTEDSHNGVSAVSSSVSAKSSDKEPVMERIDRHVDFSWWGTPKEGLGEDYRVEWEGYVPVERNDSLLFFVDAQGGYRLWIDGKLCLDASASQSFDCRQVAVDGQKGARLHVKLEYLNQRSLPAEIRLGYDYKGNLEFSEALRLARQADVVIFCGGLDGSIELEGRDRPFELPYGQDILINQLAEVNPNLIVSLHAGGGVRMSPWIDRVKAVVHLLYPGQAGGRAFAEMLSGKVVPSAKLPFTIERDGKILRLVAIMMRHVKNGRCIIMKEYSWVIVDMTGNRLSRFIRLDLVSLTQDLPLHLLYLRNRREKIRSEYLCKVEKVWERCRGPEVVQCYVETLCAPVVRPAKELIRFRKVFLQPGEEQKVKFTIDRKELAFYGADMELIDGGIPLRITVGNSSRAEARGRQSPARQKIVTQKVNRQIVKLNKGAT